MRTIKAVEKADVCILMIDALSEFESQDVNIFHLAEKKRKGIVIVVNKWDLVEKDRETARHYEKQIRERTAPFTDFPILRSEEHTSELQSLMRISYAVFCLKKKNNNTTTKNHKIKQI